MASRVLKLGVMKTVTLLLLLAAAPVFSQANDPQKILFDTGSRDEEAGKLDAAKLIFLTLAATYAEQPLTSKAREEIGAIYLFKEAQSQIQAGQNRPAYMTFRTLMRVYPDSPLAKLADTTAKTLGIPPDPRY